MRKIDIHNFDGRKEAALRRMENSDITEENKRVLRRFAQALELEGICASRIEKYVGTLCLIGRALGKDFRQATSEDLESFMRAFKARADRSVWTKHDYAVTLRRFYRWLEGGNKRVPKKVGNILATVRRKELPRLKAAELLTEQDIQALLDVALNPRDRALIAVTWETGARIGEIGNLTIGDITFHERYAELELYGKTGGRTVTIAESATALLNWLQNHPAKNDVNAPVWINLARHRRAARPLKYGAIHSIFQEVFVRAGLTKRFNPHLFRHSRATWCAEHNWNNSIMCEYFGWEQDSAMPAIYISLRKTAVRDKVLETYGLKPVPQPGSEVPRQTCDRCMTMNPGNTPLCARCGYSLTTTHAVQLRQVEKEASKELTKLLQDPRVHAVLRQVLAERSAPTAAGGEAVRPPEYEPTPVRRGTTVPLRPSAA